MNLKKRGFIILFVLGISGLIFLSSLTVTRLVRSDAFNQRQLKSKNDGYLDAEIAMAREFDELIQETSNTPDSAGKVTLLGKLVDSGTRPECWSTSVKGTIFTDDFSYDSGAWETRFEGKPIILLGQWLLQPSSLITGQVYTGSEEWRNYSVKCRATLQQGSGLALLLRARNSKESGKLNAYRAGYSLLDGTLQGGTFRIEKLIDGKPESLASVGAFSLGLGGLKWLLGIQHEFEATVDRDRITLKVDGKPLLTALDPDPLTAGRVGLHTDIGALLLIDEVQVECLTEVRARWRP